MRRDELRQIRSLILEIEEEERRRYEVGAWSLFGDDSDFLERNVEQIKRIRGWIKEIPDSVTRPGVRAALRGWFGLADCRGAHGVR